MTAPHAKLAFKRRAWQVPTEGRAFEGWLEGRPTDTQRQATLARVHERAAAWKPDAEAWDQLIQLQRCVGHTVRIQFFDPGTMFLLNDDEWPHPVTARCVAVVTMIDQGHLQAFLALSDATEFKSGGSSGLAFLVRRGAINCTLAPVADLYAVEIVGKAAA